MPSTTHVLDEARDLVKKRLAELDDERKRLERALAELGGKKELAGRAAAAAPEARARKKRKGKGKGKASCSSSPSAPAPVPIRPSNLVEKNPGITASEIAKTMKIKPNYLYRVLGDLEKEGRVKKKGRQYRVK